MTAESVLELLALLGSSNIKAWVDGGWGVDALLGYQSRPHEDVDLVVALDDVDRIRDTLALRGFALAEDHLPVRFVMAHPQQGRIDFHTVTCARRAAPVCAADHRFGSTGECDTAMITDHESR